MNEEVSSTTVILPCEELGIAEVITGIVDEDEDLMPEVTASDLCTAGVGVEADDENLVTDSFLSCPTSDDSSDDLKISQILGTSSSKLMVKTAVSAGSSTAAATTSATTVVQHKTTGNTGNKSSSSSHSLLATATTSSAASSSSSASTTTTTVTATAASASASKNNGSSNKSASSVTSGKSNTGTTTSTTTTTGKGKAASTAAAASSSSASGSESLFSLRFCPELLFLSHNLTIHKNVETPSSHTRHKHTHDILWSRLREPSHDSSLSILFCPFCLDEHLIW